MNKFLHTLAKFKRPLLVTVLAATTLTITFAADRGTPLDAADVQVNTTSANGFIQAAPAVARDADGDAVVVWQGATATDTNNIYMRRLNNYGVLQGAGDTLVNSFPTDAQTNPAVAMDAAGNYVVVWESNLQDLDQKGIYAQCYTAAGAVAVAEFKVNTFTTEIQSSPAVARSADGSFVVVWESRTQDGSGYGIYAQRYNASCVVQTDEFQINTTTAASQRFPSVGMDINGNFVVAWQSNLQDGDLNGIYARRYMADGTAVSGEFKLNTTTTGDQTAPSVSLRADGSFVAAWVGADASGAGIYMRRFDNTNAALDVTDVLVNTLTADIQAAPSVVTDVDGDTVITWESNNQDAAGGYGVYFQRYDTAGLAVGVETLVNVTTSNDQRAPAVAADADGDYLIAWQGNNTGTDTEVYARRYVGPESVDMSITKTDSPDPASQASTITYALTVTNNHAAASTTGNTTVDGAIGSATNLVVTDKLPSGVTFNSATGANWTCTNVSGTVTCTYGTSTAPLPFAAGALPSTITVTVTTAVTAPSNNQLSNTASVRADQFDGVSLNDSATATTNVCGLNDNVGSFAISDVTVNESSPTATITVTRTSASSGQTLCGPATVKYDTSNGTATAGTPPAGDYTATSGTLSFDDSTSTPGSAPDSQQKSFSVPITNDTLDENAETVTLTLTQPSVGTLSKAAGVLTINDSADDVPPTATITTADASVAESVGTKVLTVQLSTPSGRAVTVPYTFTGGATNGTATSDYTASPAAQVVILAGQTSATVTLSIAEDTGDEDDETIITTLTTESGGDPTYTRGTPNTQTTTILDNDPTPALSIANSNLTEGNTGTATMTFTVTLSAKSGRTVTVNYATSDGTATTADNDYTSSSGTLTFNPEDQTKTFDVSVKGDTTDEDDELFTVTLSSPSNATLATSSAVGTINDDDASPTVNFNPATQSAAENVVEGTATITVNLAAASGKTVTVPYTLSGTATNGMGSDYTASPDSPFTFTPGQTSKTITVSINDDALNEAPETVIVTLGSPTNATIGSPSTHTLTITDNDSAPTVFFTAASQTVAENVAGGTATITVTLDAVSGQDVTVPYAISGSATNTTDYTLTPASSQQLSIPRGTLSASVTVNITNDAAQESNETVTLTIGAPEATNPTNATVGTPRTHTLTITDDDAVPQVFFAASSQTFSEAGGIASIALRLSRTADDDITLNYNVTGTATPGGGSDYGTITPASPIIIPAGTPASGIVISVPVNNDTLDESDETVVMTLTGAVNGTVSSPSTHTLTISDDDAAGVAVTQSGGSTNVTEGSTTDSYTVVLNSQPFTDVTITINNTAQATASPTTLTFTPSTGVAGGWNLPQTVTVTAVDDNTAEGSHSTTITQTASSADMLYSGIAVASVPVNITDNDTAGVSVVESGGATLLTEGGATGSYTLALTTQPTADVTFSITPDSQVTVDKSTVTFTNASWNIPQTVTVTAVDDFVAEGMHSGLIVHGTPVSADPSYNNVSAAARNVTPQITDNDTVGMEFNKTSVTVAEAGASDTYTVKLNSQPTADVTVMLDGASQLLLSSGGSTPAQTLMLTFTPLTGMPGGWDVEQVVTVSAVDDAIAEGSPHSGMITHSTASSDTSYNISMAGTVTASITDNDNATISINDVTVTEGDSGTVNANFVVSLSTASANTVMVDYATADGTALQSGDYTAASGTLSFAPGETMKTVAVNVVGDLIDEANEIYSVALSNATGGATISDASGAGTITDDDTASYVIDDVTVTEGNSGTVTATFTVMRTASASATTVDYTTAGITATEGADFADATGTLNFPASATSTTQTINVIVNGDVVDEANETYSVTLSNTTGGVTIADDTGAGTITDDDTSTISVADAAVTEGTGAGTTTLDFVVSLSTASANTVTVDYATADGTALQPGDYTSASGTLTFAPGQTGQTVSVTVSRDAIDEANETLTLNLSNAGGAAISDASGAAIITDDDGAPSVSLSASPAIIAEEGTGNSATLTATLNGTTTTADVTVNLSYTGTAANGSDYTGAANITIPAGQNNAGITLTALADAIDEGASESLTATIGSVSVNATVGSPSSASVTINDNDTAGVTVTESGGTTVVTEGGSTGSYTLALTSQPTANVTITLNAGSQLSANPATVTFTPADYSTPQTVTVSAVDDAFAEGSHAGAITHSVASSDSFYDGIAAANASVTITDNDAAGVLVTESGGSTRVIEGGATDILTVQLTSQPTANVTITPTSSSQLTVSPTTLTFTPANYNTPQTLTLTAVNDDQVEGTHSGTLSGTVASTDALYNGSLGTVTATITDNDSVTAGDEAPAVVVTHSGGSVNVVTASKKGGGALPWNTLLGLLSLLALRRRHGLKVLLALVALSPGLAMAQGLSYSNLDVRYLMVSVDDPSVDASGFSLAGSWAVGKQGFVSASYSTLETDDFAVLGTTGSSKTNTSSLGFGAHRPLQAGLDFAGSVSVVFSKADGQGGFSGSANDTGYGLEAGLRGTFAPSFEWGAALSYVAIFDDSDTGLSAQVLYRLNQSYSLAAGAGMGDNSTQFNLGARYNF